MGSCDTLGILPNNSTGNAAFFAKNSDREFNESQFVEYLPAQDHRDDEIITCLHVELPQAPHTHAVLISRPFWMWGCEMGVNEKGLCVGNEALWTKNLRPYDLNCKGKLLGMDLVRLAVERADNARDALKLVIELIEKYGQANSGHYWHTFLYHNSFMFLDYTEMIILETAGKEYVWKSFKEQQARSISNWACLGTDWDECSPGVREKCKETAPFPYNFTLANDNWTVFWGNSANRCIRTSTLIGKALYTGHVDEHSIFSILRDHNDKLKSPDGSLTPWWASNSKTVCMHAGFGLGGSNVSNTTGAMVVKLVPNCEPQIWVTATSATCISTFKPFLFSAASSLSSFLQGSSSPYCKKDLLWWKHERIHRLVLLDYNSLSRPIKRDIYKMEKDFVDKMRMACDKPDEAPSFLESSWKLADQAEHRWFEELNTKVPIALAKTPWYTLLWLQEMNKIVKLSLGPLDQKWPGFGNICQGTAIWVLLVIVVIFLYFCV